MKRWHIVWSAVVLVLLALLFVRLPYVIEGPGPVEEVGTLITIRDETPGHPPEGRYLLTTVSQSLGDLTPVELLYAWLDPESDVLPEEEVIAPGTSRAEEGRRASDAMEASQVAAQAVALRALEGYPEIQGEGIIVANVGGDCPAADKLFPGQVVTAIQDQEVDTPKEASKVMDAIPLNEPVRFTVAPVAPGAHAGSNIEAEPDTPDTRGDGTSADTSADAPKVVSIKRAPCSGQDEPLVGIAMIPNFPVQIDISDAGVGGPSGGLMLALGLYDLLTQEDLSDGRTIAGTGALGIDGTVYPIGGVGKKVIAAKNAGAAMFLVPQENLAEAKEANVEGIELVPVHTFEDAVTALGTATLENPSSER